MAVGVIMIGSLGCGNRHVDWVLLGGDGGLASNQQISGFVHQVQLLSEVLG